jgi:hypothetical protein
MELAVDGEGIHFAEEPMVKVTQQAIGQQQIRIVAQRPPKAAEVPAAQQPGQSPVMEVARTQPFIWAAGDGAQEVIHLPLILPDRLVTALPVELGEHGQRSEPDPCDPRLVGHHQYIEAPPKVLRRCGGKRSGLPLRERPAGEQAGQEKAQR